jgi:hypothetical protein
MLFSFVYLVFVSLLKLLIGSRRPAQIKDVELIVPAPSARGSAPPGSARLRSSGRAFLAAASRMPPPQRRCPPAGSEHLIV